MMNDDLVPVAQSFPSLETLRLSCKTSRPACGKPGIPTATATWLLRFAADSAGLDE